MKAQGLADEPDFNPQHLHSGLKLSIVGHHILFWGTDLCVGKTAIYRKYIQK